MNKKSILLLMAATGALAAPGASADTFKITGAGTAYFSNPHVSDEGVYRVSEDNLGWGGGLLGEWKFNPFFGVELGAFYIDRTFVRDNVVVGNNTATTLSGPVLNVPLMLRVYPFKNVLTLGVGGYYTRALGDLDLETATTGNTITSSISYSSFNLDRNDYGVLAALGLEIPFHDNFGLLLEGRYLRSLHNNSTNDNVGAWKYHDLQALAGLRFMWGDH